MTITNEQLITLAKELVDAAAEKKLTLRVIAGVATLLTCPSIETHTALQRAYKDLDFVAPRDEFEALAEVLTARGCVTRTKQPGSWIFDRDGVEIELCDPVFPFADLTPRLDLASPTVTFADLLLIKLSRVNMEEKDVQDIVALLLDHRVGRGEGEDQVDREYIAKLAAHNWGVFTAVYDNSVLLEQTLDKYLDPEEQQLVWRRIELLQEDLDRAPKSFSWMAKQILRRPTQVPR
ncbi:MAG: hypothetical protein HY868_00865 [Chloroflexi bacterium]|nr:hypothetical protein [Chloroflexota bacterium]